jgi:hypothetical protein
MRAFENRSDCVVWDEPLYGYYLSTSGKLHPGTTEIIADQGTDWQEITGRCAGEIPQQKSVFYQKHMTLHLLPEVGRDWMSSLSHCFLIRDPERVIASYAAVREDLTLDDIGFVQQAELFDFVFETTGEIPLVIDSRKFLLNPEAGLRWLCSRLGLAFESNMLSWPKGQRDSDGIWAKYWYESVWNSDGFAPYQEKPLSLRARDQFIADQARPYYERLYQYCDDT